jgi:ubiquinone/menaquinone biosynthesis C-methylase UbiE
LHPRQTGAFGPLQTSTIASEPSFSLLRSKFLSGELAQPAQIGSGTLVADFCAGLGVTVRYLAYKYGANVTGIEFTPARVAGAQDLTRRVGLQDVARIIGQRDERSTGDASVDAVVSQESFCHVPDVKRTVMEASRILKASVDWPLPIGSPTNRFQPQMRN